MTKKCFEIFQFSSSANILHSKDSTEFHFFPEVFPAPVFYYLSFLCTRGLIPLFAFHQQYQHFRNIKQTFNITPKHFSTSLWPASVQSYYLSKFSVSSFQWTLPESLLHIFLYHSILGIKYFQADRVLQVALAAGSRTRGCIYQPAHWMFPLRKKSTQLFESQKQTISCLSEWLN